MARSFNIGGPCDPNVHYMLDPLLRLPREIPGLISQRAYFVLHAPRQTGKTTSLAAFASALTEQGQYAAALVSMQPGAGLEEDIGAAEEAILRRWRAEGRSQLPPELQPPEWPESSTGARIGDALTAWAEHCPRPLVLLLDETDALQGATLRSVLHQIRAGHRLRPAGFPASLALVGLRDLQDYKFYSGSEHGPRSAPSPFNILVESLTLANFTRADIVALYGQHTADTGQVFTESAIHRVFELTDGQPWLVNALARFMVTSIVPERSQPLTLAHVHEAQKLLMERRDMHLKTLANRVDDPRVRGVLEPLLSGGSLAQIPEDDIRFCIDLGLLRAPRNGPLEFANPIYQEALLERLSEPTRRDVPYWREPPWMYAGSLDLDRLLRIFLDFWRQHGSALMASALYPELAPQLVVLAFMQRVANGGGRVSREEMAGAGRMDIYVEHGDVRLAIEMKLWHPRRADPVEEGLEQLERYMRHVNTPHGWLMIFDRRDGQPRLIDRLKTDSATTPGGIPVTLIRS